jgi:SAM-dependent methyltransferase
VSTTLLSAGLDLDHDIAGGFSLRVVSDITSTSMAVLHLIGDRLALFDTLAETGPIAAEDFARRSGIDRRYAQEWLAGMACHRYVTYNAEDQSFSLSPEQRAVLVDRDSPYYVGGIVGTFPDFWSNADLLTESFRAGGGVPQDRFGQEWICGFERFSRPAFVNNLCAHWIPAMPDVEARLRAGGSVADIGCGNGHALIELAKGYPNAKLIGFDVHAPAIDAARANAAAAGIGRNLRFEVLDAADDVPGTYDLITCFDVVHDMPYPRPALRRIRRALAPGGRFFVMEFNVADDLQGNIDHPFGLGAFAYAASVNYCMTTALAVGGEGTGTAMGERRLRELAAEAGFSAVRRIDFPTNPFCLFFEASA